MQPWGEVEWQEGNEAVCLSGSHVGKSSVGVPHGGRHLLGSLFQGRGMRIKNSRQEEQGYDVKGTETQNRTGRAIQ